MSVSLNKQQKKAVEHDKGPLLIIAGAGTGKTTVITERIKHLVLTEKAKPEEIIALTFTEKAAGEMQERVDIALPLGYTQMWISTFHGFCDQILRNHGIHIGLDPNYKLLTQSRSIDFFRKNLFEFDLDYFRPLGNPNKFLSGLLTHVSRLQDEYVLPEEYLEWADNVIARSNATKQSKKDRHAPLAMTVDELEAQKYQELANTYKLYDQLKIENSYLDFGDLIIKTLLLFEKRPNILAEYRQKFKYILIDEFQDTNFAQNKLALMLAGENGNITVVGDDDQSIYKFRGAAVSNIMQFRDNFPKTKIIVLNQNYRSSQNILDASYKLIKNNNPDRLEVTENIDKKLIANTKDNDEVEFIWHTRGDQEAEAVVSKIQHHIKDDKLNYSDFAILVRANSHADQFLNILNSAKIPFQFLGPEKLFDQPEIVEIISYLKVLYDLEDNISLTKLLSSDLINLSGAEITKLLNIAKKENQSLYEVLKESNKHPVFVDLVFDHQNRMHTENAGRLVYEFLEKMGVLSSLLDQDNPDATVKSKNIAKLFDKFKLIESEDIVTVRDVVDWIEVAREAGESPTAAEVDWQSNDAVNILTIHSSKGLEFPVVFIANLVDQRFPSRNRTDLIPIPDEMIKENLPEGNEHLGEERRLMYVAMTRAKQKLYLTGAEFYGAAKRAKKPSIFVNEVFGDVSAMSFPRKRESSIEFSRSPVKSRMTESSGTKININYLSYSQIQTFETCPLHYKLNYLLKLPTPETNSQSFGISIHNALQRFYFDTKQDIKNANKKYLIHLLKDVWINKGYSHKKHEKQAFEQAKSYLEKYFETQFDENNLPEKIEDSFLITLPKREGKLPLKIGGKIDRIDVFDDYIEIIDYKTGEKVPNQKDVDSDMQLSFYALAAYYQNDEPFNIDIEKVKLSLYYFSEQKKITTTRTKGDLLKAVDKIYEIREEIENSDFACSDHYFCQQGCEYKQFCN